MVKCVFINFPTFLHWGSPSSKAFSLYDNLSGFMKCDLHRFVQKIMLYTQSFFLHAHSANMSVWPRGIECIPCIPVYGDKGLCLYCIKVKEDLMKTYVFPPQYWFPSYIQSYHTFLSLFFLGMCIFNFEPFFPILLHFTVCKFISLLSAFRERKNTP